VHFNSAGGNVLVFNVVGVTLHHTDFRYLGMVLEGNLHMANHSGL